MSEDLELVKYFLSSLLIGGCNGLKTPNARPFDRLVEAIEHGLMRCNLLFAGDDHRQFERVERHAGCTFIAAPGRLAQHIDDEALLAARHRQINFREQFRVEQRAVQHC
jgi:hypothetical protein